MATAAKKTPASSKSTATATAAKATAKKTVAKAEPAPLVKKVAAKPAAKTVVKKAPAAKAEIAEAKPAKKTVAKATASSVKKNTAAISPEHRYHMIGTAAYFKAQQRGFEAGYHVQDWIAAEKDIDAMLNA